MTIEEKKQQKDDLIFVIWMKYKDGCSYQGIADYLNIGNRHNGIKKRFNKMYISRIIKKESARLAAIDTEEQSKLDAIDNAPSRIIKPYRTMDSNDSRYIWNGFGIGKGVC